MNSSSISIPLNNGRELVVEKTARDDSNYELSVYIKDDAPMQRICLIRAVEEIDIETECIECSVYNDINEKDEIKTFKLQQIKEVAWLI